MQDTDLLPLYRDIRNSIDAIHDLAAAIETDLARLQIYQEPGAIPRALDKMKNLSGTIASLESSFHVCASSYEGRVHAMLEPSSIRPSVEPERPAVANAA